MNLEQLTQLIQELQREIELLKNHKHSGTDYPKVSYNDLENIPKDTILVAAKTGHLFIPTCAGAPTGTPNESRALIYDTTNNKIYFFNGSWRSTAALT